MSYCAGRAGIEAAKESAAHRLLAASTLPASPTAPKSLADVHAELDGSGEGQTKILQNFSKKRVGDGEFTLDNERLAQAISEERKRKGKGDDDEGVWGKKRKTVMSGKHDVTEEELGTSRVFYESPHNAYFMIQRHTGCTVGWKRILWLDILTPSDVCI
jgi:pre-mRNA-processing factor SLU7